MNEYIKPKSNCHVLLSGTFSLNVLANGGIKAHVIKRLQNKNLWNSSGKSKTTIPTLKTQLILITIKWPLLLNNKNAKFNNWKKLRKLFKLDWPWKKFLGVKSLNVRCFQVFQVNWVNLRTRFTRSKQFFWVLLAIVKATTYALYIYLLIHCAIFQLAFLT